MTRREPEELESGDEWIHLNERSYRICLQLAKAWRMTPSEALEEVISRAYLKLLLRQFFEAAEVRTTGRACQRWLGRVMTEVLQHPDNRTRLTKH